MKRAVQPILGIIAPSVKPLTPSQRELVRRAGTYLSPGQQMTARRRARADEAADLAPSAPIAPDVAALMPKLGRMR